MFVNICEIGKL